MFFFAFHLRISSIHSVRLLCISTKSAENSHGMFGNAAVSCEIIWQCLSPSIHYWRVDSRSCLYKHTFAHEWVWMAPTLAMKTASVRGGGRICSQNYGTYFQCTFGNFDNFLLRSGILPKSHAALLLSHVSKSKINNQKEWNGYALLAVLTIGQMPAVRLARKVFSVSLCRQLLIPFTEVMRVSIF